MGNLIDIISVSFAIISFVGFLIYRQKIKQRITLNDAVIVILASGMLPLALAFVFYPLFPESIASIESMSLQITLTGLVLLFVYIKTIIEKFKSDSS